MFEWAKKGGCPGEGGGGEDAHGKHGGQETRPGLWGTLSPWQRRPEAVAALGRRPGGSRLVAPVGTLGETKSQCLAGIRRRPWTLPHFHLAALALATQQMGTWRGPGVGRARLCGHQRSPAFCSQACHGPRTRKAWIVKPQDPLPGRAALCGAAGDAPNGSA